MEPLDYLFEIVVGLYVLYGLYNFYVRHIMVTKKTIESDVLMRRYTYLNNSKVRKQ